MKLEIFFRVYQKVCLNSLYYIYLYIKNKVEYINKGTNLNPTFLVINSDGIILKELSKFELENNIGCLNVHESYMESGVGYYHTSYSKWDIFFIDMFNYNLDNFFNKNDIIYNKIVSVLRDYKITKITI